MSNTHIQNVISILQKSKISIASLAPAWKNYFPDISEKAFIGALKKAGFWGVSETALGVDLVTALVAQKIERDNRTLKKSGASRVYITAACPAAAVYIRQKFPEFAENIILESSPLLQHAAMLKTLYGNDCAVVFIGPCPIKKQEASTCKSVDGALSFREVSDFFEKKKIHLDTFNAAIDKQADTYGSSFVPYKFTITEKPLHTYEDGGISNSFSKYDVSVSCSAIFGLDNLEKKLIRCKSTVEGGAHLLITLACPGGCSKCMYK
ncbi:MAG: hypothetical protein K6E51_02990 [Treponema sp.]|nr:hypothetical protein [Treponema sp.]